MNKKLFALLALVLVIAIIAACAPAPTPVPTQAPPTAAPKSSSSSASSAPASSAAPTTAASSSAASSARPAPKGELNLLCTPQEIWCQGMKKEFEAKYPGVTVNYVRLSAGEALTRLRNEKANPQFDIWWGGPIDSAIAAKKEGLLEPYKNATGATTTLADTVFSTVPGAPVFVGKASSYRSKNAKLGIDLDIKGHNALQSTFVFDA